MASEEQINNQQRLNDLRQEELSYIQESEEFIASTISKSAQLADTIKSQLASIREKTTLDQKVLQFSKQNVDVLSKLKVDYQDIAKVDKDRKGILDQIQKNNNVINAQGKDLTEEVKKQAKAFVEQEKALSDQQKLLSEKIEKQEQLEKIIKAQEAAGKKVDMADKALLKNAQESTRLQQMKVAGIQAEVLEAGRVADPLAVSLALLQDQNAQLEEAVGYLDDEEEAIINVEKAQGLFNISLGAAGKLLKKAGLESSALYLGLGKGAEAAEEAAHRLTEGGTQASTFGDRIKVLGAGIAGTFKGMANEIKAIGIGALLFKGIKGAFNMLGGKVITGFISDLKNQFMSGISYLKDQFFSLNSYIEDAKAGDAFNQRMSKATADIATNIGVSTKNARELVAQAGKVSASVGMLPEELAATTAELQKAFGSTQKFSTDTVKTMGQLTNLLGLSNEEAAEFVKLSQLSGEEASDTTLTYKTQIQALKERENIAISEKEIMQEIAKSSAAQQLTFRASGKSLAEAAFHAKKMGLSLAQTEAIGSNLLDFESSIANEMEAELLLGKDLNLERARSAALQGDLATVAKEVAGQIGSAAEFGKMNVIQQEALAKSVGVSRDELANMLKTQELLAGTGFDDMNDAQAKFKKLLKETGSEEAALAKMKEMGASDALQSQLRSISLEERRAQQQRNVEEAQGRLAKAVNKVFDAFHKVEAVVKRLKAVVVDQMKPFFNEFGGLIKSGAGEMEDRLVPAAEKLGQFLNKMGLRLIGLIKSIDIDKTINKVKEFAINLKNTFLEVKDKVLGIIQAIKESPLGQFFSARGAVTTLSIAPIAFKGGKLVKGISDSFRGVKDFFKGKAGESKSRPIYTQEVGGAAGGGLMDIAGKMGGRKAGIGGGFKKGFKGLIDYAKMATKGGRAGKVGRARLLRAGKGLLTGQGASFVGGAGKGATQAAGKLAGVAGKLGSLGKGLGKLAAGGGVGAVVGMAAEAALGHFAKKAEKAADAMEDGEKRDKQLRKARALSVAAETAKFAGYGAAIGTMIGGPFGAAIGGGVGALVGFTKGMIDANKRRQREESTAGKFAREQRKAAEKHAKALQSIELKSAALQAESAKEGFAKEQAVRLQFAEQLGVSGDTAAEKLAQLQNLDVDSTSEAFKSFAQDALNAGNITEEEFAAALKGTISPLDLMEKAAKTSSNNLKKLYNSAIETAGALSNELKKSILEQAGVNEDVVAAQVNAVQAFTKTASISGSELFEQFEDDLKSGAFDSEAVDTLRGTDSDSKAFQTALIKKFEEQGASADQIRLAMELYANELEAAGEDFDLDDAADIAKAIEGVGGSLVTVLESDVTKAEAEASAAEAKALSQLSSSGVLKDIGNLNKEQLSTNEELKSVLESVGVNLEEVAEGGISSDELQSLKETLTTAITAGIMGTEGSNPELLAQLQSATTADDFILRPGQPALKFNKNDLVIGGTNLEGGDSEETSSLKQELQEMKQMMASFVEQVGQVINRPIVLEMNGNKVGQALGQDSYRIQ